MITYTLHQLSKEEAIRASEERTWETVKPELRALFQLTMDRLVIPFDIFQEDMEKALERPVFTHEFAGRANLETELIKKLKPTKEDWEKCCKCAGYTASGAFRTYPMSLPV